ncbi:hypothetical protein [Radiobacillus deserti]|uniref:Uncharacterized protein n=1 Tax=Radiobacillus deserti TaxID=2594883 RepID=A0A516KKG0_9BACI|nr:hypothetical protein [Radiobacillus deserti]QDP41890.1 hypothetical protein FN924_17955 [Radiobacillus deserti]
MNEKLLSSLHDLRKLNQEQEHRKVKHWNEIGEQLEELKESSFQHEQFENRTKEWLTKLDANNLELRKTLQEEGLLTQGMIEQLNHLTASNQEIIQQLGQYDELKGQLQHLIEVSENMSERMRGNGDKQDEVMDRLENQQALMEKTTRQLDNLRSIIYERANHLSERVEEGYNLTSTFFYKLITGSNQPLNMLMMKQEKEKKQ